MNNFLSHWDSKKNTDIRRRCIFELMPDEWNNDKKVLHTAIALDRISHQLKDKEDKRKAKRDSEYYFNQLKKLNNIGN